MKEEKINNLIYKVKSDSILREEPLSSSNKFITALAPNTEMEYLNETKEVFDLTTVAESNKVIQLGGIYGKR